jgi:hypothetical protein
MCPTSDLFDGPKLKVQRASRHINEVKSLLEAFLKTEFCKASVEPEAGGDGYVLKITSMAKTPTEIPLAIGDAVHALRTALDHVISGIVPAEQHWISFPTGEKRDDLVATPSYRAIKKALPDLADFVSDKIQAYKGGDFQVWELSALDNMDKHRLLIPVMSIKAITGLDMEDERNNIFRDMTCGVSEGRVMTPVKTATPLKITNQGRAVGNIFFPKASIFENKAVIPTLAQLAQLTSKAVSAIETFYLGNVANPNATKS